MIYDIDNVMTVYWNCKYLNRFDIYRHIFNDANNTLIPIVYHIVYLSSLPILSEVFIF